MTDDHTPTEATVQAAAMDISDPAEDAKLDVFHTQPNRKDKRRAHKAYRKGTKRMPKRVASMKLAPHWLAETDV